MNLRLLRGVAILFGLLSFRFAAYGYDDYAEYDGMNQESVPSEVEDQAVPSFDDASASLTEPMDRFDHTKELSGRQRKPQVMMKVKAKPKDHVVSYYKDQGLEFVYDEPTDEEEHGPKFDIDATETDAQGSAYLPECQPDSADLLTPPCQCRRVPKNIKKIIDDQWVAIEQFIPVEVYSAYLDLRTWDMPSEIKQKNDTYSIRIIGHGLQKQHAVNFIPPIQCSVIVNGRSYYIGDAYYLRIYKSTAHADEYTAHWLICQVPNTLPYERLQAVHLSAASCSDQGLLMKVNRPGLDRHGNLNWPPLTADQHHTQITIGVCVSPLYGGKMPHNAVNPIALTEFIETHRILGVEHFTFYIHDISASVKKLLEYYVTKHVVTLVDWSSLQRKYKYFYYDQRSALNDCLYKNMGKVTYLGVMDIDEIFTPTENFPNLRSLITSTVLSDYHKPGRPVGSICFDHVLFHPNLLEDYPGLWPQLVFQRRMTRTKMYPTGKIRTKCIHAPEYMVTTDIHFGQWWVNGSIQEIVLPESKAILQHYRHGLFDRMKIHPDEFNWFEEKRMAKLREQVLYKITDILVNAGLSDVIGIRSDL